MRGRAYLVLLAMLAVVTLPGRSDAMSQVTTILSIDPAAGVYGDKVEVVASLKDADTDAGIPNKLINFLVNGQFLSATTDAKGYAVLSGVPLGHLTSGTYAAGVQARFDGEFGSTVYEASTGDAVLTVAKRPLKVIPDPVSREYGDPNPSTFTYQLENFAPDEDEEVLTSLPSCTTTADETSNAGTYPILCTGLEATNYVGDYSAKAGLTVTPAPMAVVADDQFRLYGQANPMFTASYLGAWKLGQGPGVLKGTLKCNAPGGTLKWSSVGKYDILCTGQTAANYALKYVPGTLQIAPAPLFVEVGSYTRDYGAPEPDYAYSSITGFVNADTAAVVKGAMVCAGPDGVKTAVGTHDLDCDGLAAPNYVMVYNGTLTVEAVPLTVTALNAARVTGAANPAFEVSYSGFVADDGLEVLTGDLACATAATAESGPGEYPITCSGLSAENYTLTYVDGVLRVEAAPPPPDPEPKPQSPPPVIPVAVVVPVAPTVAVQSVTVQHSEAAELTARVSPAPAAGRVEFAVGDRVLGSAPVGPGGVARLQTTVLLPAGAHTVTARFKSADAAIKDAAGEATLTVTPEEARAQYTGPWFSTGPVQLTASVRQAADGTPGDLSLATISFVDRSTGEVLCSAVPVSASGTATCAYTAANSRTLEVGVSIGGSFAGAEESRRLVQVSQPLPGRLVAASGDRFAFHAWVDGAKPPAAELLAYITAGGRTYRLSGLKVDWLTLRNLQATLSGTVVLTDVTDPAAPRTLDQAARLRLQMEPGRVQVTLGTLSVTQESHVIFSRGQ